MAKKLALLLLLALVGAGGYLYLTGGAALETIKQLTAPVLGSFFGPDDESALRSSFDEMTQAIAQNNRGAIGEYIAPAYSGPSRVELLNALARPWEKYLRSIGSLTMSGDLALITYKRIEKLPSEEQKVLDIVGERWSRSPTEAGKWRLARLAPRDPLSALLPTRTRAASSEAPREAQADSVQAERDSAVAEAEPTEEPAQAPAQKEEREEPAPGPAEPAIDRDEAARRALVARGAPRYSPVGKRDPFQALIEVGPVGPQAKKCEPDRPRELLETFDLSLMKVTGVVRTPHGNSALVETPDGKGYTVNAGRYLGRNCGLVTAVGVDSLSIRELVRRPGPDPTAFVDVMRKLELRPN